VTGVYLDSNATTRPADEVRAAVEASLRDEWANPSSVHRAGQAARRQVELARAAVAELIGAAEREIVFTSGGTEADDLAIRGTLAAQRSRPVLVTSRLEHSAVRETAERLAAEGTEVVWLESDGSGVVRLDALADLLARRAGEVGLVSIMWANNETGVIQPVEAIGAMCRDHGVRFHTDAVQWVGRMPTMVRDLPVDLLTCSAHKLHGPKGSGALYIRRGVRIEPRIVGGPQERERRGGTENVPGIIGFGVAATLAARWLRAAGNAPPAALRDRLESLILCRVGDARVNGAAAPRLWNTSNIGFPRLEAEALLLLLSEHGVYASAGAACSSGSLDPSPVLLAMGVAPEVAHGSIRFSLSRYTTAAQIDEAVEVVVACVERLRSSMSAV
jgi:cysteine desulfurase